MQEDSGQTLSKRRVLGRKDARRLSDEIEALLGPVELNTLGQAQVDDDIIVYLLDGIVQFARRYDTLFPTLNNPNLGELPSVSVDMGAIPYVCNGADVMAPGIKEVKRDFEKGGLVVVRDIKHGKALAIGTSLASSSEIRAMKKGKAIRNLHYVGDKIWKAIW
jgi:PUA-domain protein